MKAIYFIELVDGRRFYKCDTFWSKSEKMTEAKIHDDSEHDQKRFFDSLLSGFKPWNSTELSDSEFEKISRMIGSKYGYQKILSEVTGFTLPEDAKLSDPIYLTKIESISRTGETVSPTFEAYKRDNKLDDLLKN